MLETRSGAPTGRLDVYGSGRTLADGAALNLRRRLAGLSQSPEKQPSTAARDLPSLAGARCSEGARYNHPFSYMHFSLAVR